MPTKKEIKKKQPINKSVVKKISTNPIKKTPEQIEAEHEKWLFNLPLKHFVELSKEWNERNLKIKIKPQDDYDAWLNYFKNISPRIIKMLATTGQDFLPTEAYAALSRWHDIIGNPHRIDKIHQSGLTKSKVRDKDAQTITQLALNNDRLGVLKATRDNIAEKLEKGAGARDTAALAREMTEIMTQIADYEKRLGPKKSTMLGQLLDTMPDMKARRPAHNGNGARHTSFKSRVTIEDIEG